MTETIKAGIYRHYKGQLYEVLGVVRHSETEEIVVETFAKPLDVDAVQGVAAQ